LSKVCGNTQDVFWDILGSKEKDAFAMIFREDKLYVLEV